MAESALDLFLLFSHDPQSYSCRRLQQEADVKGVSLKVINRHFTDWSFLSRSNGKIFFLPRIGLLSLKENFEFLKNLKIQTQKYNNFYWLNNLPAITFFKNKWNTFEFCLKYNFPTPYTLQLPVQDFFNKTTSLENLIQPLLTALTVDKNFIYLKPNYGMQGYGIVRINLQNQAAALNSISEHLKQNENKYYNNEWLLQESIQSSLGMDLRVLVIQHQVICSFKRNNPEDPHYRSNFHLGGAITSYALSNAENQLVKTVISQIKNNFPQTQFYALDFLFHPQKTLLLNEVNISPGFEAAEQVSGINIAHLILEDNLLKHL